MQAVTVDATPTGADASHEKLRCCVNPPPPGTLEVGLARTAQYAKGNAPAGAQEREGPWPVMLMRAGGP